MSDILQGGINDVIGLIKENPVLSVGSGLAIGAALSATGATLLSRRRKSKVLRKRKIRGISKKVNGKRRRRHHVSRKSRIRRTPRTVGRRRDTSHRRIRQTKTGQPYVIMSNGRARFIKKSSARRSRKTKGGRY